jgi:hypothetical protein
VITCKIIAPVPESDTVLVSFLEYETIPVTVEAFTTKGSLIQVEILVDEDVIKSLPDTTKLPASPYNFTIPSWRIKPGTHLLTAVAYSSEGNRETDAMYFMIEKSKKSGE